MTEGFIPQHGGFRKLRSFQAAQLAYDGTVIFCEPFIDKRSRTHDQMVQAARSGVPKLGKTVVLTAWRKRLRLDPFDKGRAEAFLDAFLGHGPESGERDME